MDDRARLAEGSAPPETLRASIDEATAGRPHRAIAAVGDGLFLIVSQPARFAEEILGTLTVGYALDDAVAKRLAEVTHADVNLVAAGRLSASSLTGANRTALAGLSAAGALDAFGVRASIQRVGDGRYVLGVFPLAAHDEAGAAGRLVLLQNWEPTQQFVDEVRWRLLLAGAVIFALAICGGLVLSRRVSGPLRELAVAAGDIAGGNWARRVDVGSGGEVSVLARAFNEMTMSLRHWYEEAKHRDDQLRQAQKMEAIGRLAGGVAHDFNNLLTAIRGYTELLLTSLAPDDPRREDIDEILKASDRAAGLTRQLLAFSRREVVAPRVLALDRILPNIEQMLRRLIGEDIALTTEIGQGIWPIKADAGQIDQVLMNLAVNARDAMPSGGALRIALSNIVVSEDPDGLVGEDTVARQPVAAVGQDVTDALTMSHALLSPGPYVRISVADTGSGMAEETVQRIFEPFFTTKGEGRGTGLGLAMVYGIVQHAGGTIDVVTALGQGSTFHVYLPRCDEPAPREDAPAPSVSPLSRPWETVLLVEDDRRVNTLIANVLRQSGYTVLAAAHGEEALALSRAPCRADPHPALRRGDARHERARAVGSRRVRAPGHAHPVHVRLSRRCDRAPGHPDRKHAVPSEAVLDGRADVKNARRHCFGLCRGGEAGLKSHPYESACDTAFRGLTLFREDHRQHAVGRIDAAIVVSALGHDHHRLPGAEVLVDVFDERFASRPPRRALRHRRARGVEAAEWQHVYLAQEVGGRPCGELLLQLIVAHAFRVAARPVLQTKGPSIVVGTRAGVERTVPRSSCAASRYSRRLWHSPPSHHRSPSASWRRATHSWTDSPPHS